MGKIMQTAGSQVRPLTNRRPQGLVHARVNAISGQLVEVEVDRQRHQARVAFSCLVVPQPGDLVLCDCTNTDDTYILSVLERPEKTTTILQMPGEVVLQAQSATFVCEDKLNFISSRALHKSSTAVVDIDEVTATGNTLQASFKHLRLISQLINTMAHHVVERAKTYLRQTEDHDQLQAGQMTRKVGGLFCMESQHTVMVSRKDTKIDGERIHMG